VERVANPGAVYGRSNSARAKILIGEPAEAIPLLEQAIKISPRDPEIGYLHYRLGLANLLLGNVDKAIRWSEKAVLTYYSPRGACRDLAVALGLKGDVAGRTGSMSQGGAAQPSLLTKVRRSMLSDRPKFVALLERTVIEGLRKAAMPER
jgi:tetratricopeptide (TPR) repeat protein